MTALKRIWSVFSTIIVIFMVVLAVLLMGSRLIGFECYTVISGSMEPTYSVGDLLYVKEVDPKTIKEGDPITFLLNEQLDVATHRVIKVDAKNQHLYTKGDANNVADANPVHFKNVIGVPKFHIPLLGYVSNFVQNPPGTYITIGVGIFLILLVFLPDLLKRKKPEEQAAFESEQQELALKEEENEKLKAELEKLKAEISGQTAKADAESASEEPENTEVASAEATLEE